MRQVTDGERRDNAHLRLPRAVLDEATLVAAANPEVIEDRSALLRLWIDWGRALWHQGKRP